MPRRSSQWFSRPEYYSSARRAWLSAGGLPRDVLSGGKPLIGIANTGGDLVTCHAHFPQLIDAIKRGVWEAGGVPLEFPVLSTGEMLMRPTAMLYRNLMAMDVEESIRAYPFDGVVLPCGCDKTTPALLMAAASANVPAILAPGGPMLGATWRGRKLGAGTDGRKLFDQFRSGALPEPEWNEVEGCLARTAGHCHVMGTATTMTALAEVLGLTLPGAASIPAPDARRLAISHQAGRRIVALVDEDLTPSRILTPAAFHNALTALMALGGSTNAVVHLLAIAGRVPVPLTLEDFDRHSRRTPYLVNVKPAGEYLAEDLFDAGGVPALLHTIAPLLHQDALTVSGRTLGENIASAECLNQNVIRALDRPLHPEGGIAILRGSLAPSGAVFKPTAAAAHLHRHRGRAVVFSSYDDLHARIDSDDLPVDANSVLVMQNGGPRGAPGFPEWGQLPIPRKLLRQGVTDLVRISDARMSGTSFGAVVLHVAPESAAGGPLACVRDGDEIELDVAARRLDLCVPPDELARRRAAWTPPPPHYRRGYGKLFLDHVTQAHEGCDFDFLRAVE